MASEISHTEKKPTHPQGLPPPENPPYQARGPELSPQGVPCPHQSIRFEPIPLSSVACPIHRLRQQPIAQYFLLLCVRSWLHNLVTLRSVTTHMRKLEVGDVRWVTTLLQWNDMVHTCTHRMRPLERLIHRLATYPAYILGGYNLLPVLLERRSMFTKLIRSHTLTSLIHGIKIPRHNGRGHI